MTSPTYPPCPESEWTQQMLVEAESRDEPEGGMGVNDSCTLSVHTSHCLEKWEKRQEGF